SPTLDGKRLDDISSFDLEILKNNLSKAGLAPATVKHCLVLFRQIFNKTVLWGLYNDANPIKGVKLPTLQNQRERFLTFEEATLLLEALKLEQSNNKNPCEKKDPRLHDMALI